MTEHDLAKGLEVWGLQTLLDISILIGILALGWHLFKATTARWKSTSPCGCPPNCGG